MSLTAPCSEVSSAIYNIFLSELLQYIGNMFKKSLNVNDAWFGFYSHFKIGTFDYRIYPCIIRTPPPILRVHFGQKKCVLYKGKYGTVKNWLDVLHNIIDQNESCFSFI